LEWLMEAVWAKGLWRRNRVYVEDRVRASQARLAGLGYRDVAYVYRLVQASYVAVSTWVEAQESNVQG